MLKKFYRWLFPPIIPGQIWKAKSHSPWDKLSLIEIIDTKDGWVRYQFKETRCGFYDTTNSGIRMFYSLKKGSN
jgi:hypothetical protein